MNNKICYFSILLATLGILYSLAKSNNTFKHLAVISAWDKLVTRWEDFLSSNSDMPLESLENSEQAHEIFLDVCSFVFHVISDYGIKSLSVIEIHGKKIPEPSFFSMYPNDFEDNVSTFVNRILGRDLTQFVIRMEAVQPPRFINPSPK